MLKFLYITLIFSATDISQQICNFTESYLLQIFSTPLSVEISQGGILILSIVFFFINSSISIFAFHIGKIHTEINQSIKEEKYASLLYATTIFSLIITIIWTLNIFFNEDILRYVIVNKIYNGVISYNKIYIPYLIIQSLAFILTTIAIVEGYVKLIFLLTIMKVIVVTGLMYILLSLKIWIDHQYYIVVLAYNVWSLICLLILIVFMNKHVNFIKFFNLQLYNTKTTMPYISYITSSGCILGIITVMDVLSWTYAFKTASIASNPIIADAKLIAYIVVMKFIGIIYALSFGISRGSKTLVGDFVENQCIELRKYINKNEYQNQLNESIKALKEYQIKIFLYYISGWIMISFLSWLTLPTIMPFIFPMIYESEIKLKIAMEAISMIPAFIVFISLFAFSSFTLASYNHNRISGSIIVLCSLLSFYLNHIINSSYDSGYSIFLGQIIIIGVAFLVNIIIIIIRRKALLIYIINKNV